MDGLYYDMIFKRRSFHVFKGKNHLSESELREIQNQADSLEPLVSGVRTAFKLVPRGQTTCRRGEYCILIYSERKEQYLQNAGYMAEQLDLWLASKNIGACWYGMGKANETTLDGLAFVIMIAIEKADETEFRKDYTKAKRKSPEEIWSGGPFENIALVARYAPSACNSQPWLVERDDNTLKLYRVSGKRGMMSKKQALYYNQIDVGIFMLFLELCCKHEQYSYTRELCPNADEDQKKVLTAVYRLSSKA